MPNTEKYNQRNWKKFPKLTTVMQKNVRNVLNMKNLSYYYELYADRLL